MKASTIVRKSPSWLGIYSGADPGVLRARATTSLVRFWMLPSGSRGAQQLRDPSRRLRLAEELEMPLGKTVGDGYGIVSQQLGKLAVLFVDLVPAYADIREIKW